MGTVFPRYHFRMDMIFGLQDEWKAFGDNHPAFATAFGSLTALIEHSLAIVPAGSPAQNIAYQLRRECVENYMEILVLAGNGYGHASWRELRSMYEKAVTAPISWAIQMMSSVSSVGLP
jgi:hypothetical protein